MKKKQNIIFIFLSMLLTLVFLTSCSLKASGAASSSAEETTASVSVDTTQDTQTTQAEQTVETSIKYPEPAGFVNDFADFFTKEEIIQMEDFIKDFEKKTTAEIVVVTVKSLEGLTIEKFAFELFNTWGISKAGKNNGILLLIAPGLIRIEVGLGLEEVITNKTAKNIIDEIIIPYFKESKYGQGSYEGVKAIAEKISLSQ